MSNRQIAELIADDLFTNGAGEMADRLVLMCDQSPWSREAPRDLGGYSKAAVIDVIERGLIQQQTAPRSRSKKQKIADKLRESDVTARMVGGRPDIEYGPHDTLPLGEHVANRRG